MFRVGIVPSTVGLILATATVAQAQVAVEPMCYGGAYCSYQTQPTFGSNRPISDGLNSRPVGRISGELGRAADDIGGAIDSVFFGR